MATRKRRGDRREDNKKGGCKGAPTVFYLFFFVSDATWQERGEGSTLPTSVLRDKGRAESLPHLFRGADTLPVGFEGNGKGITPFPRVFDANGEGGPLPHFF